MSDRREFFRRVAGAAAGALLAGGTAWLALGSGEPCWTDGGCRRCPKLSDCDEAEARITRVQRLPQPRSNESGKDSVS